MIRQSLIVVFCLLVFVGRSAAIFGQQALVTIVIENVGASDRAIIPMIISTSEEGLTFGRTVALRDTGIRKAQTYIVPKGLATRMVQFIRAMKSNGADSLKSLGNLRLVAIQHTNDESSILLSRANGVRALRKLESLATQGDLKADLADLVSQLETIN